MTSPPASGMPPAPGGQPPVGRREHGRHPLAARVERRPPRPRGLLGGHRLAQPGGDLLARAGAPARQPGVRQEDHRPDDAVGERLGVPVRVVGAAAQRAVAVGQVVDERDRVVVRAERGAGERQAARGGLERLPHRLAPRPRVAGVVHLVQHDERAPRLACAPGAAAGARPRPRRSRRCRGSRPTSRRWSCGSPGRSRCRACAAASDHCVLRCSVGVTTVIASIRRSASSSAATRSANVVLPAPGVATVRKSRGAAREVARQCAALPGPQRTFGSRGRLGGLRHSTPCTRSATRTGAPRGGNQGNPRDVDLRAAGTGRVRHSVTCAACPACDRGGGPAADSEEPL